MTLLARGAGLRRMATAGLAKSAELEARENQTAAAIDQAKQAQEMNTLGTGAGFGAMYGMKGLGAAGTASGVIAPVGQTLAGTSVSAPVSGTITSAAAPGAVGVTSGGAGGVSVAQGLASTGITTGTAATGTAAAGGTAAATGTATAAGSAMSALSTIAAPVAIGLGVAYLLNKLFD